MLGSILELKKWNEATTKNMNPDWGSSGIIAGGVQSSSGNIREDFMKGRCYLGHQITSELVREWSEQTFDFNLIFGFHITQARGCVTFRINSVVDFKRV